MNFMVAKNGLEGLEGIDLAQGDKNDPSDSSESHIFSYASSSTLYPRQSVLVLN